jgi:hypothetical protein
MKHMLIVAIVLAHDAPSGWQYPSQCCTNQHCREVPCSTIERLGDTIYRYHRSTTFYLDFPAITHAYSPDGKCHTCINGHQPLCIFTPIPAGV